MSRKVILYITVSLDGYVVDENGKKDWIRQSAGERIQDDKEFRESIDTVLMGRRIYEEIVMETQGQEWPFSDLKTYVFTRHEVEDMRGIAFIQKRPEKMIQELKKQEGKDLWLCGDVKLINRLISHGLIDVYRLRMLPTILGGGIPLFSDVHPELRLKVESVRETGGIIDITYSDLRNDFGDF